MRRRETHEEYRARMKRFEDAKAESEFYDTGLGMFVPDALAKRLAANKVMWDNANAPARDEYPTNSPK